MVHPHSVLVVTATGSGCVIEIIYVTFFLIYSDRSKRLKVFLWLLLGLIFITALTLTLAHTTKKRSAIVGIACIVFNIMMYASPLVVMVPNGIETFFAVTQLILYATYYKSTKRQIAARKANGETDLSRVVVGNGGQETKPSYSS